jgi:hypothetical protein
MKLTIPGLLAMGMLAGPIAAQAAVTFSTDTQTDLVGTFSVTGTSVESATPGEFDFGLSFCMPVRVSRGTTASAGLQCAGSPDDPRVSLPNVLGDPQTASSISGATDGLAGTGVPSFSFSFSDLRDTGGAGGTFSGSFCFSRRPAGCPSFEPAPQAATLDGFYAPVDPPSVATNNARAGQTIPLKFHAETAGGPITGLSAAVLTIANVACTDVTPAADTVEESSADTSVALANLGGGDYQYNWKTAKSDAGTCKTIMLSLPETYRTPTRPMATFRFL